MKLRDIVPLGGQGEDGVEDGFGLDQRPLDDALVQAAALDIQIALKRRQHRVTQRQFADLHGREQDAGLRQRIAGRRHHRIARPLVGDTGRIQGEHARRHFQRIRRRVLRLDPCA